MNTHRSATESSPVRALGYTRCSTTEQHDSGLGLDAQTNAITTACAARGWDLVEVATDVASGKSQRRRPELARLLGLLARGEADALVVSRHDRLGRSLIDSAGLLADSREQGWEFVALDLNIDTSTAAGEFAAHVLMAANQYERRVIAERTKDSLAAAQRRGVVVGRRTGIPDDVRQRIIAERAAGKSLSAIANGLNDDGVPTGQGGARWWAATIKVVLDAAKVAA